MFELRRQYAGMLREHRKIQITLGVICLGVFSFMIPFYKKNISFSGIRGIVVDMHGETLAPNNHRTSTSRPGLDQNQRQAAITMAPKSDVDFGTANPSGNPDQPYERVYTRLKSALPYVNKTLVEQRQKERRAQLKKTCKKMGFKTKKRAVRTKGKSLHVDEARKLLYCLIPKVVSTNWKRALVIMNGSISHQQIRYLERRPDSHNPSKYVHEHGFMRQVGITSLNEYKKKEINNIIENYYRIIFVRNPYERLVSAYRDKLLPDAHGHIQFKKAAKRIKWDYNNTHEGPPTFSEFLQSIVDENEQESRMNYHWRNYQDQCHPCTIKYDFIGKLDTLYEDANYLIQYVIGLNYDAEELMTPTSGPSSLRSGKRSGDAKPDYYDEVPEALRLTIRSLYAVDAEMFGYKANEKV